MSPVAVPATTLSASAIARAVFDIEAALDLNDPIWLQGDVHWWPLYRLEIYRLLFVAQATGAGGGAGGADGPATSWLRRCRHQLGSALKFRPLGAVGTVKDLKPSSVPDRVWLVSDGLSWSRLGDLEVERFCTPLQQWCNELGVRSTLIDRASGARRLGQGNDHWWAPTLQRRKIAAALLTRLRPNPQHARLVQRVVDAAARVAVTLPALSARRFDTLARAVLLTAELLHRRIKVDPVRAVFVVGFYDVTGYAFTLAAARAGVPCIDVQHGVTGPHHLAYTPWPALPRFQPGWRLLPSHFWSWSAADASMINDWGQHSRPARLAVCGGHPFLQAWAAGSMKLPAAMQTRLDHLLLAAQGRQRVLVTLQPGLTHADALAPLLQAWILKPEMSWWLRLHPMALAEGPRIQALAQAHGLTSFDIETATALPLPALLAQAHVHTTHSSSTVIEAQTLGLASVVWSEYGAELAQEQVTAGVATLALDGRSLVDALSCAPCPRHLTEAAGPARLDGQNQAIDHNDNPPAQGPAALRRLLEMNP
jgi:hypothetical protein